MDQTAQPTFKLLPLIPRAWEGVVLVTLLLLPLQTRWIWHDAIIQNEVWEYGRFSLYGVDLLILLALVLWLASRPFQPTIRRVSPLVWMSIAGLLFVSFLSIYFALDSSLAINGFSRLLEGVLLFFLITQLRVSWRVPVWTVVLSGAVQSLLAFFEFILQQVPESKWLGLATQDPTFSGVSVVLTTGGRFLRAYGTFPHPNILGGFLVYCIVLAIALLITTEHKRIRTWVAALLPGLSAGLLFSFSRQSVLGLLVSLMSFPSMMAYRAKAQMRLWTWGTGIVFVTLAVLGGIFAPLVVTRLNVAGPLEKYSLDARASGVQQAKKLLVDVWPQGVGIGNYTLALQKKIDSNIEAKDMQPVHILGVLILAEVGIFGLAFYVLFLIMLFWEGRHHPEPARRSTHLAIAGALVIIPVFLGLWDHYLWSLAVGQWMFWSMCGLAVLVTHPNEQTTHP